MQSSLSIVTQLTEVWNNNWKLLEIQDFTNHKQISLLYNQLTKLLQLLSKSNFKNFHENDQQGQVQLNQNQKDLDW